MKKFFYSAAIAAVSMGLVACGGKESNSTSNENQSYEPATTTADVSEPTQTEEATEEAEETVFTATEEPAASSSSENKYFTSAELDKFVSDGKSGDFDRMISALEWYEKTRAALKPDVRNIDENAIKAVAELEKANESVGGKYDSLTLEGALNSKMDEMSESQKNKVSELSASSVLFFTAKDDTQEYNKLYRKYRYGSFF